MICPIDAAGIGKALPNKEINSSSIDTKLNLEIGTTKKITGLEKRYFVDKCCTPSQLLLKAIKEALSEANLNIDDIDCIINASATMEQAIPYNAASTI